ncbi:orotidine 5'-phosphate decarboxylase [Candidatus Endobugula sertula]|uniref:Orotidine 5'-phosphate decarboxylase n=1 Tax=Candidatus Endobugula sertula TaxID=62101 RepID=A0A1D2QNF7_9GAMM|nr:orotidine 5'-phosphate decarboxylase [Candidatus Endobugula sertula]
MFCHNHSPIIVAMDFANSQSCLDLASQLNPSQCRLKVGKELFTSAGPQLVESLINKGFDVFLDLKYHDIPNTVAKAVKAAADLGVWMVNVHASGGRRMLDAAREAVETSSSSPLLIAVTVLTSMTREDLLSIGIDVEPQSQVMRLAILAKEAGLDGVVCSAMEAQALKAALGKEFCLVTPGIRPENTVADDQRRIVTPHQALSNGSDYLVIGRPITQAENPASACSAIYHSL